MPNIYEITLNYWTQVQKCNIEYCSMQSCSILFTVWWRHKVTMAATIVFLAWFFHFLYWGYLHTKLDIRLSWWVMAHRQKWPPPKPSPNSVKIVYISYRGKSKIMHDIFWLFQFCAWFFYFFYCFPDW